MDKTDLEIIKEAFTKIGLFYVIKKTSENWIFLFICYESEKKDLESMTIGDIRRYKNNTAFWEFNDKERFASC